MNTGNQHASRKHALLAMLKVARIYLRMGWLGSAREALTDYRRAYARAPASTRRRWKCGY